MVGNKRKRTDEANNSSDDEQLSFQVRNQLMNEMRNEIGNKLIKQEQSGAIRGIKFRVNF